MDWETSSGWRWDSGIAVWVVQSLYTVRCGNGVFLGLGVWEFHGVAAFWWSTAVVWLVMLYQTSAFAWSNVQFDRAWRCHGS